MKIHLVFGLITAVLLVIVIGSRRQDDFSFNKVTERAEMMAREGYLSAVPALPKKLRNLDAEQYAEIHWKDERTLWRQEGLPFQVKFIHPGYTYDRKVDIEDLSEQRLLRYSPAFFDFGKSGITADELPDWVGYGGFRLMHPFNKPDALDELLSFVGGANFRAVAKDLVYGTISRAIVVDPLQEQTETPVFTRFWLKRPDTFSTTFTVYALLESGSVTGAYQFDIEGGAETRIRVKATLYFRRVVEQIGYAPLISMFWFGENTSNTFGDFRPEVHKADGLLMHRDNDEWVWHPLSWSAKRQINAFEDKSFKGFGLFQRDRDFNHYQDLTALFHKMPSVWVEPVKGFEDGSVYLLQNPTKDEKTDNVAVFWSPNKSPDPLKPVEIEYVLRWMTDSSDLPPLGRCLSTRVDFQQEEARREFFLDFGGGPLDRLKNGEVPTADVTASPGAVVSEVKIERNDFNKTWRISFVVNTNEKSKPTELLCRLTSNGVPLTETWSYTWTP